MPGYGCNTPPSRLVLPPWLPIRPQRKGHHGLALAPCERRRIRACRPHAALSKGEPPWIGLAQPLRPTSRQPAPARASSPRLRARPRSYASGARSRRLGRGLSRARRQPRLADASRRFAVADARVDRCARLRRCASMGFDGPIRPFGPDARVEAHETSSRYESEPIPNRPLDNHIPIRARGQALLPA